MQGKKLDPQYKQKRDICLKMLRQSLDSAYGDGKHKKLAPEEKELIRIIINENLKHPDPNNTQLLTPAGEKRLIGKEVKNIWVSTLAMFILQLLRIDDIKLLEAEKNQEKN